ncbi:MAG: hypothetical protein ACHQUC_06680 [Chlamydiales bacterium]
MKRSIFYKARIGLCVLALALSATLVASQEEVSQEASRFDQDYLSIYHEDIDVDAKDLSAVDNQQDSAMPEHLSEVDNQQDRATSKHLSEVDNQQDSAIPEHLSEVDNQQDSATPEHLSEVDNQQDSATPEHLSEVDNQQDHTTLEYVIEVDNQEEDLSPESPIEVQNRRNNVVSIVPEWLVKEKIIPNLVLQSEEVWRSNAIFLKDALEALVFHSKGNEIEVISDRLLDNSKQISQLINKHNGPKSDSIRVLLNEQNFTLYAYTLALKFDPAAVPKFEAILDRLNRELIDAISSDLRKSDKFHKWLNKAFEERLRVLKEEAKGFVHASESDPNDFSHAYEAFDHSLLAGQEVGSAIGWRLFYKKH